MFNSEYKPANSLGGGLSIIENNPRSTGVKCYVDDRPTLIQNLGSIRTFPTANRQSGKQIDLRGKKPLQYNPTMKKSRPQRIHLSQQPCTTTIEDRGIKTFEASTFQSNKQYFVEKKLQTKTRVEQLEQKRNGVGMTSLGDKSYKIPQHSSEFYKAGGLLPGSSIRMRKGAAFEQLKIVPLSKPNYDVKVKMEEQQNDRRYLADLQKWEESVLKDVLPPKIEKVDKGTVKPVAKDTKKVPKK